MPKTAALLAVPEPPKFLNRAAKIEYSQAIEELDQAGVVIPGIDFALLAIYAQSFVECGRLTQILNREGLLITLPNGIKTAHPAVAARANIQRTLLRCCAKLGFSPADRSHLPFDAAQKTRLAAVGLATLRAQEAEDDNE